MRAATAHRFVVSEGGGLLSVLALRGQRLRDGHLVSAL